MTTIIHNLNHNHNNFPKLKKENFGSKWPKTTLAAVFDNAVPERMTLEELTRLKQICQEYGQKINIRSSSENDDDDDDRDIPINQISLVQYKCRSLEKVNYRVDVSLEHNGFDLARPSNQEKEIANSVVGEWSSSSSTSSLEEYLAKVNQPGSRMNSYRQSSSTTSSSSTTTKVTTGATCVAFLDGSFSSNHTKLRQIY